MKKLLYIFIPSIIIASCSSEPAIKVEEAEVIDNPIDTHVERVAEIDKHSAILFSDSLNFNSKSANDLLAAYEEFIKHHSFETISLDYQFKAGELAKSLNKPHIAIKHFNDLRDRSPEHEKAGLALFYKAMIIGDMLHEDELAKATYQEFIDTYPEHPFVESAKASIELQGKSLDEIVAGFEEKNS
jgi:TolA-binding protein